MTFPVVSNFLPLKKLPFKHSKQNVYNMHMKILVSEFLKDLFLLYVISVGSIGNVISFYMVSLTFALDVVLKQLFDEGITWYLK